jgi:hypothetical protein
MTRYGILALVALGMAIPLGAQNTRTDQNPPPVQAQANASAAASADASSQSQNEPRSSTSSNRATSASAAADGGASASASAGDRSLDLQNGSRFNATLLTTLDAKHSKPGERVVARTTQNVKQDGNVVLRKGTHLVGHVTEASARSKDHAQSSLGIVFDHAVLRNGQQVPLHLSIQALASEASAASTAFGGEQDMLASSGQAGFAGAPAPSAGLGRGVAGVGGVAGGMVNNTAGMAGNAGQMVNTTASETTRNAASVEGETRGATGGLTSTGYLTSNSNGVFGLDGLNLNSAAGSATQASVVNSTSRNVHLASGTQMVLQVAGR